MHGYKLVAELEIRDAEDWAPISRPQVYYSIKKLAKLGLIEPATTDTDPLGPEREVFRITSKGTKAMNDALSRLTWAEQRPPSPFMTWMALSTHLSSEKTSEVIKARQKYLTKQLQKEKRTLAEFAADSGAMVTAGRLMVSLTIELFEAELKWLQLVLKELPKARQNIRN
ncbi:MAG: PadR family transcriptional regulator [Oligoflexia bacterium]|nr:PadR family transcriptional regulator [Oligoflexia bacterium]